MSVEGDNDILSRINGHAFMCAEKIRVADGYVGATDENGQPHGLGKQSWSNGKLYDGEFHRGKPHGRGFCQYPFWDTYEGEWQHGKRHGKGLHHYANGNMYEGQWKQNKRDGEGRFVFASGYVEEGWFQQGVFVKSVTNKTIDLKRAGGSQYLGNHDQFTSPG